MKPPVGATYERENERRTVVMVTRTGSVEFWTSYLTHDFGGPDPSRLVWERRDHANRKVTKRVWSEWVAWAEKVVDATASNR